MNSRWRSRIWAAAVIAAALPGTGSARTHWHDDGVVDGDTGVLHVSGVLTRGACNVDNDTAQQTVDLGVVDSGRLAQPGQQGSGRTFQLRLEDCFDAQVTERRTRTGNEDINDGLPFVRVSFFSARDTASPGLIAVQGAGGFGLRLEDAVRRVVHVNERGEALRVPAGEPVLTYRLVPERTRAPLKEGAWHSTVYMGFSYD